MRVCFFLDRTEEQLHRVHEPVLHATALRTYTHSFSLPLTHTHTHTPSCINGICLYTDSRILTLPLISHVRALSLTHAPRQRTPDALEHTVRFGHDTGADPEMRLRNGTFLTVIVFGLCGFISLSWYTAFSNSKGKTRVYCVKRNASLAFCHALHSNAALKRWSCRILSFCLQLLLKLSQACWCFSKCVFLIQFRGISRTVFCWDASFCRGLRVCTFQTRNVKASSGVVFNMFWNAMMCMKVPLSPSMFVTNLWWWRCVWILTCAFLLGCDASFLIEQKAQVCDHQGFQKSSVGLFPLASSFKSELTLGLYSLINLYGYTCVHGSVF